MRCPQAAGSVFRAGPARGHAASVSEEPQRLDEQQLAEVLDRQDGVVSRGQVLACGGGYHDIRRRLRRRIWARVHPGVYVGHTGELTWRQRAWAAVLYAGDGAALDGYSALRADAGPGWRGCREEDPIRVAVDVRRTVADTDGVRIRRVAGLADKVRWAACPPRLRVEEATLDLAMTCADDHEAFETLARSVRGRSTTAQRLLDVLESRPRAHRRAWLLDVLTDIRDGTCSVLEHRYLRLVERAHGLPQGVRQQPGRRSDDRAAYRDVAYDDQATVVELDGRVHDEPDQRDDDLERDLDVAVEQRLTLRLGWRQVFRRSCHTAARVAAVLQARGWQGEPLPCGPDCVIGRSSAA